MLVDRTIWHKDNYHFDPSLYRSKTNRKSSTPALPPTSCTPSSWSTLTPQAGRTRWRDRGFTGLSSTSTATTSRPAKQRSPSIRRPRRPSPASTATSSSCSGRTGSWAPFRSSQTGEDSTRLNLFQSPDSENRWQSISTKREMSRFKMISICFCFWRFKWHYISLIKLPWNPKNIFFLIAKKL